MPYDNIRIAFLKCRCRSDLSPVVHACKKMYSLRSTVTETETVDTYVTRNECIRRPFARRFYRGENEKGPVGGRGGEDNFADHNKGDGTHRARNMRGSFPIGKIVEK